MIGGNVIAGSAAVSVIHGHGSVHRFKVLNNTIALAGHGALRFTGIDGDGIPDIHRPGD